MEHLSLVDEFLADNSNPYFWSHRPKLFYLWGHSYEFDKNGNWQVIEEFAEKIGGREDVWYATNGEIFRYVEAFKALRYSVDGQTVYNPTATAVYLKAPSGKKVLAPAGEYTKLYKNIPTFKEII